MLYKKVLLKILQYSQENACVGVSFEGLDLQLYLKDTPTKVFSCKYFEIFNNTYFEKHLRAAASVDGCIDRKTEITDSNAILSHKKSY